MRDGEMKEGSSIILCNSSLFVIGRLCSQVQTFSRKVLKAHQTAYSHSYAKLPGLSGQTEVTADIVISEALSVFPATTSKGISSMVYPGGVTKWGISFLQIPFSPFHSLVRPCQLILCHLHVAPIVLVEHRAWDWGDSLASLDGLLSV